MADRIVVSGVKPYDGEYELDLEGDPLTTLEWRWVKKIAGYLPLTVGEGMAGGDADLFCAFAVIAMRREGKIEKEQALEVAERLADAPFGSSITFVGDEAEDDVGPPGLSLATSEQQPRSEPKPSSSENSRSKPPLSSGSDSPTSLERSENDQSPTGTGVSVTSSPAPTVVTQAPYAPLI